MSCGELAGVVAELALGALTGRERGRALAHLEWCDACQETVEGLAVTSDDLLGLLPDRDPPPGFWPFGQEGLSLPEGSGIPSAP
jgi:hypothetical protein